MKASQGFFDDVEDEVEEERMLGAYTYAERRAKIRVFLDKRKRRNWRKKVSYGCRKKLADSRPRVKGRFVPRALQEKFEKEGCNGPGVTPPKRKSYQPTPPPSRERGRPRKNPKTNPKPNGKRRGRPKGRSQSQENKQENEQVIPSWKKLVLPKDRRSGSGLGSGAGSEGEEKSSVLIPFTNYYLEMHPLGYYNEDMMPLKKNRPRTNSLSFLNAISSYTRHTEGIDTSHVSTTQASYA